MFNNCIFRECTNFIKSNVLQRTLVDLYRSTFIYFKVFTRYDLMCKCPETKQKGDQTSLSILVCSVKKSSSLQIMINYYEARNKKFTQKNMYYIDSYACYIQFVTMKKVTRTLEVT